MPTIVFDFLDTLVRFDEVINVIWQTWQEKGLEQHRDAVTLFEDWYHTAMMDYVAASHSGLYRSFIKVLHGTLARAVYKSLGILPLEDNIHRVVDTFRKKLTPALESLEALGLALAQGWNVWILTQGDKTDTWNYLKKYGVVVDEENDGQPLCKLNHNNTDSNDKTRLGPVFVMSCDELKVAKPHPKVYAQIMRVTIRRTQRIEVSIEANMKK
ncbi:hypothetical protein BCR42DRAFT_420407 [Absidia repens]|uniref:HAD-like domain-containing protein n=1 Tax=Absidia repens TaxID=90262 RepID=A0A1X2I9N3_9FUNG|nr:hypothetical protein BCR42DRAFT_420407 [Absidia repens]